MPTSNLAIGPDGEVVNDKFYFIVAVLFAFAERSSDRTRIAKRVRPAWRVVAAKALVFGLVAFATQLVALVITVQLSKRIILADGGFQLVGLASACQIGIHKKKSIGLWDSDNNY